MSAPADIAANLARVREQIAVNAARAGRDPASIRLVAVTKNFPPEVVRAGYECGLRDFGENRVQEFCEKLPQLNLPGARFHLIGHLQSNKVHQAMSFDWIQTVDSERLARRLNEAAEAAGKRVAVLIQVKLGDEPVKSGVPETEVEPLAALLASLDWLEFNGLMTLPPYTDDPECARPYFRRLRELRDRLRGSGLPQVQELSMGMTHDFPIAIEEGATIVRIGTAIFGPRETPAAPGPA
jgi:pyridoxal phosphate enzyme (YggS family)